MFFFDVVRGKTPRKVNTLGFLEISDAFFDDLEAELEKKSQGKTEYFVAGRPKMGFSAERFWVTGG